MIDVCPVGALTSKPFRYAARTWELARRRSVSPHDSLGSNLIVQVKGDRVLRVVPFDNPAVNECWISDKDRFSYEGLASDERLAAPMIKEGGEWKTVDWPTALDFVARGLETVVDRHGGPALGTLVSPHATLEEMALAARLTRALGSDNIDFRLRQSDFRGDGQGAGVPWLGMPIADLDTLDRVLVIGSFLRKDHPLAAQRLRQAARKGAQISLAAFGRRRLADSRSRIRSSPRRRCCRRRSPRSSSPRRKGAGKPVPAALAGIEPVAAAQVIAASLLSGEHKAILLGNYAEQHPEASQLFALAQALAEIVGAKLGCLTEAANSVGGYVADALPQTEDGLNAQAMLAQAAQGLPACSASSRSSTAPIRSRRAPRSRSGVRRRDVAVPARHALRGCAPADRSLHRDGGHVRQLRRPRCSASTASSSRSAKRAPRGRCLRVLGSMLGLAGVRLRIDRRRPRVAADGRRHRGEPRATTRASRSRSRPRDRRRARARRRRADPFRRSARAPRAVAAADRRCETAAGADERAHAAQIGVAEGAQVKVRQGGGEAVLAAVLDAAVPAGVVRIAAAHPSTCGLGGLSGPITVERA